MCVLLGREADIQIQFHLWARRIIIINDAYLARTRFNLIQIRCNQIATALVFVAVLRTAQLLPLRRQLAAHAITCILYRVGHILRTATDMFHTALFLVEFCEELGKAIRLLIVHQIAVLRDWHDSEIKDTAVFRMGEQIWFHAVVLNHLDKICEHIGKTAAFAVREVTHWFGCFAAGTAGQLTTEQRRQSFEMAEQPAVCRRIIIRVFDCCGNACLRHLEQVHFVLRGRHAVK